MEIKKDANNLPFNLNLVVSSVEFNSRLMITFFFPICPFNSISIEPVDSPVLTKTEIWSLPKIYYLISRS